MEQQVETLKIKQQQQKKEEKRKNKIKETIIHNKYLN
jgi:hypothetical protein